MTANENLIQTIPAGAIIKPWIMLGAYNLDVSQRVVGLTYFEQPPIPTQVGYNLIAEAVEEVRAILTANPQEGQAASFWGKPGFWNLVRGPEEYLSWGTYNIKNHLGAALLSTLVTPTQPGMHRWRILTRVYQRVLVAIAGKVVFDSDNSKGNASEGAYEYTFEAALGAGENRLNVALLRVARMAQVGIRLECLGDTLQAQVPLPDGMSLETRLAVEEELGSIRFERDLFYPEHAVGFRLEKAPASSQPGAPHLTVAMFDHLGHPLHQAQPTQAGALALCQGADLPDDTFTLRCTWNLPSGQPLTATTFTIRKISPQIAPQGDERSDERRKLVLTHYATSVEPGIHEIWGVVAHYALGQYDQIDESVIRRTCLFIAARNDCADFVIQGVLRLMFWERSGTHLSPEINALMKDTILGFKYWVDEPGDTVMYMGSENHRLLFHVAEWMAGLLFPTEEFTNSRQNGLFHSQKAYVYITEWMRQRGRFGYDEWHSNSYLPVCIAPIVNVYDFCLHEGQYKLRQMVQAVLDQIFFYLAADTYRGTWGVTHGRSYGIYVKYADFDGTTACCWLLYGTGALTAGTNGMAPICLASSAYRPPSLFTQIAHDDTSVVEAKQRQGILRGSLRHANYVVYRTPDYLLSGLQDHRKGEFESSTHIAQVTLANKAVIFWSCPHTTGEGSGLRPDYWSGHTTLPRVIQHKNVMALTWRLTPIAWMSHCWLEPAHFDEVKLDGNWVFVRSAKGYVGIYSQNGLTWADSGQYAGRELQCAARENTWLVECGREADWGSFSAFVSALQAAKIEAVDGTIRYNSPSIGEFVTGWDVKPSVAGQPIQLSGYPLYDSPWAHADFGSGEMVIRYQDQEYEIWFNQ
jgi:hypothetical protein